tara:strand:+ start:5442 stop:5636 length:195 start_codon:yes stop_codon:yes gene_type:complete
MKIGDLVKVSDPYAIFHYGIGVVIEILEDSDVRLRFADSRPLAKIYWSVPQKARTCYVHALEAL